LHSELEQSLQSVQDQLYTTSSELEQQKVLNEKLENDLFSVDKHKLNGNVTPSESGGLDALASLELGKRSTVKHSISLGTSSLNGKQDSTTRSIPFTPSADTSILPIVTSQRDRFRQRNAELEDVCFYFYFL
jgi:homeobox protein cut-like